MLTRNDSNEPIQLKFIRAMWSLQTESNMDTVIYARDACYAKIYLLRGDDICQNVSAHSTGVFMTSLTSTSVCRVGQVTNHVT